MGTVVVHVLEVVEVEHEQANRTTGTARAGQFTFDLVVVLTPRKDAGECVSVRQRLYLDDQLTDGEARHHRGRGDHHPSKKWEPAFAGEGLTERGGNREPGGLERRDGEPVEVEGVHR